MRCWEGEITMSGEVFWFMELWNLIWTGNPLLETLGEGHDGAREYRP